MLSKCAICGSEQIKLKKIDHYIKRDYNIVFVDVEVESCKKCGEIYFTPEQIKLFEDISEKLKQNKTNDFRVVGKSFKFNI